MEKMKNVPSTEEHSVVCFPWAGERGTASWQRDVFLMWSFYGTIPGFRILFFFARAVKDLQHTW
jgi:hypothetical protein